MSFQENSTFEQSEMTNLMNTKDVECFSSIKRTPLQTLSPNSPLLLLKSRGSTKRRSPLYERFVKVSQSTPIYKSDDHCATVKDTQRINATPVLNVNRLPSIVPNDVITYGDLSEVSLNTSNFSLLENISIPEVTASIPSLGQIDMQDDSFDIHTDLEGTRCSNDICSTCEDSFNESDNKENRTDYIYEDISSDDNDDFLFHSRNSDSKIFLVPPLEDDLAIESLDDVELRSACKKSGSDSSDRPTSSSDLSMCQCQTSGSYAFQKSDSDAFQTSSSGAYETASSDAHHASISDACPTSSSDISAGQTSNSSVFECESSSEFGDNEDSDEAGNPTTDNVKYSVEMEQAFACSLQEIQYLIKNGMFLDSLTDDPRYVADTPDGYIPASLLAYEPEEGETDETEGSCSLHLANDDISDVSGESLSPGEIGSSLFSDNCSLSSSHSSSRRSSTCSNLEQDLLQTSDSLFEIHQLEGSSDSYEVQCPTTYTELDDDDEDINFKTARMPNTTEIDDDDEDVNFRTARMPHTTELDDDDEDVNFKTARMFLSADRHRQTVYFRDYGGVCDDLMAEMGEHGMCLTSSSACIQSGDPPLLDVVQESGATSLTSDENWSLKVHTDSFVYQNEVDIWDCHALQGDLVDYFGVNDGNLLIKNDFAESALQPEVSSLDLQEDLEHPSKPSSQPGEIFENVDLENNDSDESDYNSVEEQLLDTSNELLENAIEIHSFSRIVSEENVGSPAEDVADTTDLNDQPATCAECPQAIFVTDDQKLHNIENDSPDGGACLLLASDRTAENPARASIFVENLGYAHSDPSDHDNAEDDDDDEWENISYDDEDCLQDSNTKTDGNLASCAGEASLIGGDVKENQTVEALAAVQKEASGRCELSPEVSDRSQRSQAGNWRCNIL